MKYKCSWRMCNTKTERNNDIKRKVGTPHQMPSIPFAPIRMCNTFVAFIIIYRSFILHLSSLYIRHTHTDVRRTYVYNTRIKRQRNKERTHWRLVCQKEWALSQRKAVRHRDVVVLVSLLLYKYESTHRTTNAMPSNRGEAARRTHPYELIALILAHTTFA